MPPRARSSTTRELPLGKVLLMLLSVHAGLRWHQGLAVAPQFEPLPAPPAVEVMRVIGLGDTPTLSRLLMLWIHTQDTQPGLSIPFRELDYGRLAAWLKLCLVLDPQAQAPLAAASRLYAQVDDPARSRQMLGLVAEAFPADPARRWRWLVHAVHTARARLHDLVLARALAQPLSTNENARLPDWVRLIEIHILEEQGQITQAARQLEVLLASGRLREESAVAAATRYLQTLRSGSKTRKALTPP
jgi:hypothetical protein